MLRRALAGCALTLAISCGQGPPNLYLPLASTDEADGSGVHDAAGGVRILSDVAAPREIDAHGGAPKDATARGRDGDLPADGGRGPAFDASIDHDAAGGAARPDGGGNDALPGDAAALDVRVSDAAARDATTVDRIADERAGQDTPEDGASDAEAAFQSSYDAQREAAATNDAPANHLLLSEVVTHPSGAEMIEIANPTSSAIDLSDYLLSDSHLYYRVATNEFTTASGSDFAARFPSGSIILPGQYLVVAIGNASGGSASFEATYGKKPDFELRPSANGASDDPSVPNMSPAQPGPSIGATSSLTDGGELVVLFFYRSGPLVFDADYLFFGVPTAANAAVDKTGIVVGGTAYRDDTPAASQLALPATVGATSFHRCIYGEPDEKRGGGNGLTGHDETSESATKSFVASMAPSDRTPGGPAPAALCAAVRMVF